MKELLVRTRGAEEAAVALHERDHHRWRALDRLEEAARVTLRWTTIVRPHDLIGRGADLGRFFGRARRPAPPSRRLSRANMSRAAFLFLIGGWLTVVVGLLALVLVLRAFA